MRLISPGKEINCFEGMGLNRLCLMRILCLFLIEIRALEGERRSTYWCMPAVLYSLSILPNFSFLFFFLFLLSVYLFCCNSLLEVAVTMFCDCDPDPDPPAVHSKVLSYSARYDQILPF